MKKVLLGKQKGYLIKEEEFQEKVSKEFPVLKGKELEWVSINGDSCNISIDHGIETEKNGYWHRKYKRDELMFESIIIPRQKLKEILGIKESVTNVCRKNEVEEGKFHSDIWDRYFVDKSKLYFFIMIGEDEIEAMKEIE